MSSLRCTVSAYYCTYALAVTTIIEHTTCRELSGLWEAVSRLQQRVTELESESADCCESQSADCGQPEQLPLSPWKMSHDPVFLNITYPFG
jgi:hypothetical protein